MRHPRAPAAPRRIPPRPVPPPRRLAFVPAVYRPASVFEVHRPTIIRALRQPAAALNTALNLVLAHGTLALKIAAGALAVGIVALAIINNLDVKPAATGYQLASLAPNETIVFRRAPPVQAELPDADAAAGLDDQRVSYFQRAIQTIRFINPKPRVALASVTGDISGQGLIKVHGFTVFTPKESTEPETGESIVRRIRRPAGTFLDEIDDYLWEVYQRAPIKRDSTGDFTWKDPAAAKRMGISLQDYVIGGMAPDFRERIYKAGRAMDADGIPWSMLSAFRDDYRQTLASGFKARTGNSLHGGSRRTGGYGFGRAIDITSADGNPEVVWQWLDANGAKYGLARPMPGADPAHIQQKGDWGKASVALRDARSRVASAAGGRHKGKTRMARAR
jgi:hypothetical protein